MTWFPSTTRLTRGFTLIELMIGLVVLLVVGGVVGRLVADGQRIARAQIEQVALQDAVRTGLTVVANELRAIGSDEVTAAAAARYPGSALTPGFNPDLLAFGPDSITYRGMRALGFTCAVSASADIVLRNSAAVPLMAARPIAASDSILLFVENDPAQADDDLWLTVGLAGIPDVGTCPDGSPGVRLHIVIPVGLGITVTDLVANMVVGGPVRAFEVTRVRSYLSGGRRWLGLQVRPGTGTVIEPMLGPLSEGPGAARGFLLAYADAGGGPTATANDVREIEVSLTAVTDELVRTTGRTAVVDTFTASTRIALRNTLQP
jgi:prepilin-type N-terminal cleavage/methylation domain-containing protein